MALKTSQMQTDLSKFNENFPKDMQLYRKQYPYGPIKPHKNGDINDEYRKACKTIGMLYKELNRLQHDNNVLKEEKESLLKQINMIDLDIHDEYRKEKKG